MRTDNVPMVERQVEDSEKLVHQLKRQLQQLQLDQGHARQDAPAGGFGHNVYTKKRSSNYSHKQQGAVFGERGPLNKAKLSVEEEFRGFSGRKFHFNDSWFP